MTTDYGYTTTAAAAASATAITPTPKTTTTLPRPLRLLLPKTTLRRLRRLILKLNNLKLVAWRLLQTEDEHAPEEAVTGCRAHLVY